MIYQKKAGIVAIYLFLGFTVFLLLGGLSVVNGLITQKMATYDFYCLLTFPFAVILTGFGFFGLYLMIKSRRMFINGDNKAFLVLFAGFALMFMSFVLLDFVGFPRGNGEKNVVIP